MVRIFTKKEMKKRGVLWNKKHDCPTFWNNTGKMDNMYGFECELKTTETGEQFAPIPKWMEEEPGRGYWVIYPGWYEEI